MDKINFKEVWLSSLIVDIRTRSSTKKRWGRGGSPLKMRIGSHFCKIASLMLWERTFIHKIKIYGDVRSPWHIPLVELKKSVLSPFIRTAAVLEQIQFMMRLTRLDEKLK